MVLCVTVQSQLAVTAGHSSAPEPESASSARSVLLDVSTAVAASLALPLQCANPWGIQP